ncbi:MAG: hypothetical protein KC561_21290 [Myxococcales bacterium]|nr:hypothetical protein [Myxococcales bacterium]
MLKNDRTGEQSTHRGPDDPLDTLPFDEAHGGAEIRDDIGRRRGQHTLAQNLELATGIPDLFHPR